MSIVILTPDKDASIHSEAATSAFGSSNVFSFGKGSGGRSGDFQRHSVFTFNEIRLPAGSTITKADLNIYQPVGVLSGTLPIRVFRITEAWIESQVTWNNVASGVPWTTAGATVDESVEDINSVSIASGGWKEVDVINNVIDAVTNRNGFCDFAFKWPTTGLYVNASTSFNSIQSASNKPYLAIQFEPPSTLYRRRAEQGSNIGCV